ncbi:MAG TPA: hypothetical protein VGQ76_20540 [Thermoanaerobaculia bacterium]|jgi:hypothetical protein|nr:hypothetical protein [Thermoanaerobaculia bacterium]
MDIGRLFKWIVIIGLGFFAFKYVVPWVKQQKLGGSSTSITNSVGDDSCAGQAERASEKWGSGLAQFVNPPYDLSAWSSFKSGVESQISTAEARCTCANESCTRVHDAMRELRGLVSDMDSAIRGGSSPGGIVARQERIDVLIDEARDLQRSGK